MRTVPIRDLNQSIEVPQGAIGVVGEVFQMPLCLMRGSYIVFPGYPLPGVGAYPYPYDIVVRTLYLLGPGERHRAEWAGLATSGACIVINANGRAGVERAGILRLLLGPGTEYKDPQRPSRPRS